MFLTRFDINPRRRAARTFLSSPHRVHAGVMAAFPDDRAPEADGRLLWRLDEGHHDIALYIVSPDKPDLHHLAESVGRPEYGWQTREYGPFLDRLADGDVWSFRLRANPVHNVPSAAGGRGKRFAHVTPAQQRDWLLTRATRCGFSLVEGSAGEPDVVVRDRRTVTFDRRGRDVTLGTAVFEGRLRVEDRVVLRSVLTEGLGPAKGYGCGLLTLAR